MGLIYQKARNKNLSTIQKEELWKYAVGQDKRMLICSWIGHGILSQNIGIMN